MRRRGLKPSKLRRGTIATLLVPVRNAGPDAAEQVKVVLTSNVDASYAAVAAPTVNHGNVGGCGQCWSSRARPRSISA